MSDDNEKLKAEMRITIKYSPPQVPEPRVHLQSHVERSYDSVDPGLRTALVGLSKRIREWPLYLWGGVGVGKTCAALAFSDRCYFAEYYSIEDLCFDTMFRKDREEDYKMYNLCRSTPDRLVILDELGCRAKVGDLERSIVKRILDAQSAKGFPLLMISNQPISAMAELYEQRIASRLGAGAVYHLSGTDRRKK